MNKVLKQISEIFFLLIIFSQASSSQSIDETLSNISSGAVLKYTEPAIDAFGSSMNSGWFTGLPVPENSFHAKLRFIGVGSFFSDDLRRFNYAGELRFTSDQVDEIMISSGYDPNSYPEIKNEILSRSWKVNFNGPTITGSKDEHLMVEFPAAVIQGQTIDSYTLELTDVKGYLDGIDLLPSPALQLDFGSVAGTGVSFRYFRGINLYDLGIVNVWGGGLTHNINYWFPEKLPVEIGLGYYFQSFKVGDIFENTASQYGIFASKKVGGRIGIEPYFGMTYETSRSEINYLYEFDSPDGPQELALHIDYSGDKTVNFMIGTSVNFSLFILNLDYKFGGTNTGTAGVGFGF